MKSVLISIKPKWCKLIANGKKTVEVRKTRPKIETPFKCYIYCTQARNPIRDHFGRILMYEDDLALTNRWGRGKRVENPCGAMMEGEFFLNGKVIGEFVCDYILEISLDPYGHHEYFISDDDLNASCLTVNDLWEYANGKTLYGWHISDLVIYDKPKEIKDFCYPTEKYCEKEMCGGCPKDQVMGLDGDYAFDCEWERPLKRPPQSWCYVEESR